MPTIVILDGIKISIFPNDHNPPHIHIDYAEYHALFDIGSLKLFKGELPAKILKKAAEWSVTYQGYLLEIFTQLNPALR